MNFSFEFYHKNLQLLGSAQIGKKLYSAQFGKRLYGSEHGSSELFL